MRRLCCVTFSLGKSPLRSPRHSRPAPTRFDSKSSVLRTNFIMVFRVLSEIRIMLLVFWFVKAVRQPLSSEIRLLDLDTSEARSCFGLICSSTARLLVMRFEASSCYKLSCSAHLSCMRPSHARLHTASTFFGIICGGLWCVSFALYT